MLDGFRSASGTPIRLDTANGWIADVRLNAGDVDGRTITVELTDNGLPVTGDDISCRLLYNTKPGVSVGDRVDMTRVDDAATATFAAALPRAAVAKPGTISLGIEIDDGDTRICSRSFHGLVERAVFDADATEAGDTLGQLERLIADAIAATSAANTAAGKADAAAGNADDKATDASSAADAANDAAEKAAGAADAADEAADMATTAAQTATSSANAADTAATAANEAAASAEASAARADAAALGIFPCFVGPDDPTGIDGQTVTKGAIWMRSKGPADDYVTWWEGEPDASTSVLLTLDSYILDVNVYDGTYWNPLMFDMRDQVIPHSVTALELAEDAIPAASTDTAGLVRQAQVRADMSVAELITALTAAGIATTSAAKTASGQSATPAVSLSVATPSNRLSLLDVNRKWGSNNTKGGS